MTPTTNHQSPTTNFYTHDGNKNVSEVVGADCAIIAHYEYAPFGAAAVRCGMSDVVNPWRFSSEYADISCGLVYYNYRHYDVISGRWMVRDPIGERLDVNVNLFCMNNAVNMFDARGLLCTITIWAGHSSNAVTHLCGLIKNKKGPDSSDYIGYVSCSRDERNADADKAFPGRVIPGIPRDPGALHNDLSEDNPKNDELASKGLQRAWDAALDAGNKQLCGHCCSSFTIVVQCDAAMARMTEKLYIWGMNPAVFKDKDGKSYPSFDWCKRKETIQCPASE